MVPAFIDGRTQQYTAVIGAKIVVALREGREFFFKFYCDDGQDVGDLIHAQEQTFFNAVASPRVTGNQKKRKARSLLGRL
jgi:hypothetical protein